MFCPKCGSLLMPKKEGEKTIVKCSCGYTSKGDIKTSIKEEVKKDEKKSGVVEEDFEALPSTEIECPKCHHKKAYFWEIQTRAGDEAATQFFKCEKCKHTWRNYD